MNAACMLYPCMTNDTNRAESSFTKCPRRVFGALAALTHLSTYLTWPFPTEKRLVVHPLCQFTHQALKLGIPVYRFLDQFEQRGLPLWLQPVHIRLLSITADFVEPCLQLIQKYEQLPLRIEVDDRNSSLAAKVKAAQEDLIPRKVVIGQKEAIDGYAEYAAGRHR